MKIRIWFLVALLLVSAVLAGRAWWPENFGVDWAGNVLSPKSVVNKEVTTRLPEVILVGINQDLSGADREKSIQDAAIEVFARIPKGAEYKQIILVYGSGWNNNNRDFFEQQGKSLFQNSDWRIIGVDFTEKEANLTTLLQRESAESQLLIMIDGYHFADQANLQKIQQNHLKTVLDNPSKKAYLSTGFNQSEMLKSVYQWAKDRGALRPLLSWKDANNRFVIEGLTKGTTFPTKKITIAVMGDVMLGRFVRTLMDRNGLDYPFKLMNQVWLKQNDLLIANLEGPVAEKAINTTKAIAFRFAPDVADLLAKYHFDAVSLANNHTLDMGKVGLEDSFRILEKAGIQAFGHPRQLEREKIWMAEQNGLKMAWIGLNDVDFKFQKDETIEMIKELAGQNIMVIPYLHWGVEYKHQPENYQKEIARRMIDAGATMVIGHHPHVVQGMEIYQGRPIFYSLGNAVFDQYFSKETQEGLTLTMIISEENIEVYFFPIKITRSQMELMSDTEKSRFMADFISWSELDEAVVKQISAENSILQIDL